MHRMGGVYHVRPVLIGSGALPVTEKGSGLVQDLASCMVSSCSLRKVMSLFMELKTQYSFVSVSFYGFVYARHRHITV